MPNSLPIGGGKLGRTRGRTHTQNSLATVGNDSNCDSNKITNSGTTGRGRKRGNTKGNTQPGLMSDYRLVQALEEAEYEAYVDPYRGMVPYFSVSFNNPSCENGPKNVDFSEKKSPWIKCSGILSETSSSWRFDENPNREDIGKGVDSKRVEIVNVDDDEENKVEGDEFQGDRHIFLAQCGCPSVDQWGFDELEQRKKQLAALKKKKRKRNGKKRKHNPSTDPGNEGDGCFSIGDDGDVVNSKVTENEVICGNRKPSDDATKPCQCDFNPFCLASAGGLVDRFLQNAAINQFEIMSGRPSSNRPIIDIEKEFLSSIDSTQQSHAESKINQTITPKNNPIVVDLSQDSNQNGNQPLHIRQSISVDAETIRSQLQRFIHPRNKNVHLDDFLEMIRNWKKIIVMSETEESESTIQVSTPPGLRNLGATCYLNSQLQCLAQNLGFTNGLFRWKKQTIFSDDDSNNRMDHVLETMKSVLAQMRYGPESVVCTNEFASALSLENDEMQDPNEFARLLFDRMQDSFRQSAETGHSHRHKRFDELLPSIFGGVSTYITTCKECNTQSKRDENHMGITVPIQHWEGSVDNVEFEQCIAAILQPEILEGGDQYFCPTCNKKCDATRQLKLGNAPPVLNIQIARYVYDMKTWTKRKLKTKVLLPRILALFENDENPTEISGDPYILCAIQNHQGNSAHAGHYTAEVMDWTTGLWYEFNDEEVVMLEYGPQHSVDATSCETSTVQGSADAYSLFYVKQSYLSNESFSELERCQQRTEEKVMSLSKRDSSDDIVASVDLSRIKRYRHEEELEKERTESKKRIVYRQKQIWQRFLSPTSKLSVSLSAQSGSLDNYVWMDGVTLRRVFSLSDGMEDFFEKASDSSINHNKPLECEHSSGLHPIIANSGTLLRKESYFCLEQILLEEYAIYLKDKNRNVDQAKTLKQALSSVVYFGGKVTCEKCGSSYQNAMRQKMKILKTLIEIHEDSSTGKNDYFPDSIPSGEFYLVSRKSLTSLRKYAEQTTKLFLGNLRHDSSETSKQTHCGRIDCLDFGEFTDYVNFELEMGEHEMSKEKGCQKSSGLDFDPLVNSTILCPHGSCLYKNKNRSLRIVSADLWNKIVCLLPHATPLKFDPQNNDQIPSESCVHCMQQMEEECQFPKKLENWTESIAAKSETDASLNDLLLRGQSSEVQRMYPSAMDSLLLQSSDEHRSPTNLRVLHHIDVQRYREAVELIGKAKKTKAKSDAARKKLDNLLFASKDDPPRRQWKFRSLICDNHETVMVVPSLPKEVGMHSIRKWLDQCKELDLELLTDQEFESLVGSWSDLEKILHGDVTFDSEETRIPNIILSIDGDGKASLKIEPATCDCKCVITTFSDECFENGKICLKRNSHKRLDGSGDNIVDVEKARCTIVLHEIEDSMDIEVAASNIMAEMASVTMESATSSFFHPRRLRKRKTSEEFPTRTFNMSPNGNLAHLQLLVHQSASNSILDRRLFILPISPFFSSTRTVLSNELKRELNSETICEIVSKMGGLDGSDALAMLQGNDLHVLMKQNVSNNGDNTQARFNLRKKLSQKEEEEEIEMMSFLTELADSGDHHGNKSSANKSKKREEKGFRGTFLSSNSVVRDESKSEVKHLQNTVAEVAVEASSDFTFATTSSEVGVFSQCDDSVQCINGVESRGEDLRAVVTNEQAKTKDHAENDENLAGTSSKVNTMQNSDHQTVDLVVSSPLSKAISRDECSNQSTPSSLYSRELSTPKRKLIKNEDDQKCTVPHPKRPVDSEDENKPKSDSYSKDKSSNHDVVVPENEFLTGSATEEGTRECLPQIVSKSDADQRHPEEAIMNSPSKKTRKKKKHKHGSPKLHSAKNEDNTIFPERQHSPEISRVQRIAGAVAELCESDFAAVMRNIICNANEERWNIIEKVHTETKLSRLNEVKRE